MRINTNISSLSAQRQLSSIAKAMSQSLARLSSGKRINQGKDDASGLAISTGLTSQIRGYAQIQRSLNDANATLQVADGAIAAQIDLVQRMRELAIQSANGTLSDENRAYLNSEFAQLLEEVDRIAKHTSFQDSVLLDGTKDRVTLQAGTSKGQTIDINFTSTRADKIFTHSVGSGAFSLLSTFATNNTAHFVRVADIDNDGLNDLVYANGSDFSVKLGVGKGLLSSPITLDVGATGRAFDLGDVNKDGNLDIVFGEANANYSARIAFGDGKGSFTPVQTVAAGTPTSSTRDMNLKDIDGDNDLDIIQTSFNLGVMAVYLNNGDGTFTTGQSYSTGGTSSLSSDVADLNSDGQLDVVIANYGTDDITIFMGTGTGQFATAVTMAAEDRVFDPHLVDLNEDGILDIVATAESVDISVYIGNGDGTFQTRTTFSNNGNSGQYSAVGDFNNDGHIDLIGKIGTSIALRLGNGDGTFATVKTTASGQTTPYGFGVGDINNDDVLDVMVAEASLNIVSIFTAESFTASATQFLRIETQENAENSLELLDTALGNLLAARATLGAQQNRLEIAVNQTVTTNENLSMARSQILDTDFATETAELVKNQILEQAGISVLSQANMNLKLVLSLLVNSA